MIMKYFTICDPISNFKLYLPGVNFNFQIQWDRTLSNYWITDIARNNQQMIQG